jgi:hypothetical protein
MFHVERTPHAPTRRVSIAVQMFHVERSAIATNNCHRLNSHVPRETSCIPFPILLTFRVLGAQN